MKPNAKSYTLLKNCSNNDNKVNGAPDEAHQPYPGTPCPIPVLKVSDERRFELDIDALEAILLRDSIRDKPLVVVSIAGDFRKGKSFMLNFFLRYLQSSCGTTDDWLGSTDTSMKGFAWRGGAKLVTTGILMWSEPFVIKLDDGQEVAIVLMDTQGAFDSEYTFSDSATVFALSTMTSSIQVFNLMHNLQEDNLQMLQFFAEYGRLALESTGDIPFQKLMFLIRDWSFPYDHPYGQSGGDMFLEEKLAIKEKQPIELQRIRQNIRAYFSDIGCYLMPYPGREVAINKDFDGRVADIDSEFVDYLKTFVPLMLDPKNVVVKEIGGRQVTGKDLLEYFKVYYNVLKSGTLPEPSSMLEATAEANNLAAVLTAKDAYLATMEAICGKGEKCMSPTNLLKFNEKLRADAIKQFDEIKKFGGREFSTAYKNKLMADLDQTFDTIASLNAIKFSEYNKRLCF
ncbi:unnamed protein product [Medioppia subpectinata]|uniref:GB1/RHD3-type G domain-containing protein n=1 Tax=Medioppia subpectinata TaxID=1979941 RepID=A0A7R9KPQ6_9ACAR|nr:unnamed protein product [Medioppia subpectinata]CAG2107214.1 unnamed protein product [Medioppia subpectinata]